MECTTNPQGFMRLKEVLKLIPVSRATWWRKVKSGEFPKGYALGANTTAWRVEDINALIARLGSDDGVGNKVMT